MSSFQERERKRRLSKPVPPPIEPWIILDQADNLLREAGLTSDNNVATTIVRRTGVRFFDHDHKPTSHAFTSFDMTLPRDALPTLFYLVVTTQNQRDTGFERDPWDYVEKPTEEKIREAIRQHPNEWERFCQIAKKHGINLDLDQKR